MLLQKRHLDFLLIEKLLLIDVVYLDGDVFFFFVFIVCLSFVLKSSLVETIFDKQKVCVCERTNFDKKSFADLILLPLLITCLEVYELNL